MMKKRKIQLMLLLISEWVIIIPFLTNRYVLCIAGSVIQKGLLIGDFLILAEIG